VREVFYNQKACVATRHTVEQAIGSPKRALGKGRLAELPASLAHAVPLEQERSAIASSAVECSRATKQSRAVGGEAQFRE